MTKDNTRAEANLSQTREETSFYKTFRCGNITIEGYSRAPIMTFWRIPELKIGFDLGWQPWEFMGVPRYFVTHAHLDHILALPAYLARRRMMEMTPPTLFFPEEKVDALRRLLDAYALLDNEMPCEIVPVKPGDEIEISKELVATVHKTYHSTPSVGYVVWERRRKLKPEYAELAGPEIRDLRASGVEINYEVRSPRVAFLGDSSPQGLDENPDMYRADVLIAEMTQIKREGDAPLFSGHMTGNDYFDRRELFQNKTIIAAHFSVRYAPQDIEAEVREVIPDMLDGRLVLA